MPPKTASQANTPRPTPARTGLRSQSRAVSPLDDATRVQRELPTIQSQSTNAYGGPSRVTIARESHAMIGTDNVVNAFESALISALARTETGQGFEGTSGSGPTRATRAKKSTASAAAAAAMPPPMIREESSSSAASMHLISEYNESIMQSTGFQTTHLDSPIAGGFATPRLATPPAFETIHPATESNGRNRAGLIRFISTTKGLLLAIILFLCMVLPAFLASPIHLPTAPIGAGIMTQFDAAKNCLSSHLTSFCPPTTNQADYASRVEVNRLRKQHIELAKMVKETLPTPALADDDELGEILVQNARTHLMNVNFFAPSFGAHINPYKSSPTASRQAANVPYWTFFSVFKGHVPNPLIMALEPWSEPKDCWCTSPSEGPMVAGRPRLQLAVELPQPIYPTDVVIEHFPATGILDSSSTPRELELWAQVPNEDARAQFWGQAAQQFGNDGDEMMSGSDLELDQTWVKIARFTYDRTFPNHVQTFPVGVSAQHLRVGIQKLVLRATSNYGGDVTCLYRVRLHGVIPV